MATAGKPICWIVLIGLAARGIAGLILPSMPFPDSPLILANGQAFWRDFVLPGDYWMPLYQILAGAVGPQAIRIIDILASTATIVLVYRLSRAVFNSEFAALASASMAAIYPLFVFFASSALAETMFITFTIAAIVFWYEKRLVLGSVVAILAILVRPTFDLFAPVLLIAICYFTHRMPARKIAGQAGIYAALYVALMSPWWVHNYYKYQTFVRLTPGFGTVLYIGNNPMNKTGGATAGTDFDLSAFDKINDPIERNRALTRAAIDHIKSDPAGFVFLSLKKLANLYRPWPIAEKYSSPFHWWVNLLSVAPVLLLALACLALVNADQWRRMAPLMIYAGLYTAVHMVMLGLTRYRLPLDPVYIVLAGYAAVRIPEVAIHRLVPSFSSRHPRRRGES